MRNINFHTCIKVDNKIWFISVEGYLMNFDVFTYQSEIIVPHNLSKLRFKQVTDNMISFNEKIYFVEQEGDKLYEYSIITNHCNYYIIPKIKFINWGCFAGVYLFGQFIYLFPKTIDTIYYFDLVSKKFSSIGTGKKCLVRSSFRIQNNIYLYGDEIICFDISNNSIIEICDFHKESVYGMYQCQSTFFVLKENGISIWDYNNNLEEILYREDRFIDKFLSFIVTKSKIFLLPNQSENIVVLDKESGNVSLADHPHDLYYVEKGWAKYYRYFEEERYVWCANRVSNYMLCIDKKLEQIRWIKLKKPPLKDEIPYLKMWDKKIFYEKEISIEQFLLINNKKAYYGESKSGKNIWINMVFGKI